MARIAEHRAIGPARQASAQARAIKGSGAVQVEVRGCRRRGRGVLVWRTKQTLAEWARHRQYSFGLQHDELPRKRRRRANLFAKAVAARHDRVQRCSPGPQSTRPRAQPMAVAATQSYTWMSGHALLHCARKNAAQRPLRNDARGKQQPQLHACFLPMGSCSARIQGTLHRRAMLQRHMGGHTYHATS